MKKIKVLAVVGPTASGKTSLAVELAKRYNGEVVSCDSMQIYKHISIGTAKPTEEEKQGIPHHLIDFAELDESFSVADYTALAHKAIADIDSRGKLPVICGGTGLYFNSLIDNLTFSDAGKDEEYRRELVRRAENDGAETLFEELRQYDEKSAESLDPSNLKRIIRAMEHYKLTGKTITEQNEQSRRVPSPYEPLIIGINFHNREILYGRINSRVDMMLEAGLEAEAKDFYSHRLEGTASAAIGYKELKPYLDGEISLEQAAENLKQSTRRFAKRQLTWFRRDERVNWIYGDDELTLAEQAVKVIEEYEKKRNFN